MTGSADIDRFPKHHHIIISVKINLQTLVTTAYVEKKLKKGTSPLEGVVLTCQTLGKGAVL